MIELNLIQQEDIAMPTKYYCQKMSKYMTVLRHYAIEIGYSNALNLIERLQNTKSDKRKKNLASPSQTTHCINQQDSVHVNYQPPSEKE